MNFRKPLPTFCSYAHEDDRDRRHLVELQNAMAEWRRKKVFADWDDREIRAGEDWEPKIIEKARRSRVFVFIVTNRFINSDFCIETELRIARKLYSERKAAIAPVLAEPANWKIDELVDLHVIMPSHKAVTESRPAAWTEAGRQIGEMADALMAGTYSFTIAAKLAEIPRLLPFTVGREQETETLKVALRGALRKRPFVCVVTGAQQSQSEFIENLLIESGPIREVLDLTGACRQITINGEDWIGSSDPVNVRLDLALASQVISPLASPDREGIAKAVAAHLGLTVVQCELSEPEWRECGSERFRQFLSYWEAWPELNPDRPLIVFLSVQADLKPVQVPGGIFLPLSPVTPTAVSEWLETPSVRQGFLVDRLREHFDKVFGAKQQMPMEKFAKGFLPLLRKYAA